MRVLAMVVGLLVIVVLAACAPEPTAEQQSRERIAKVVAEKAREFNARRPALVQEASRLMLDNKPVEAVALLAPYTRFFDGELRQYVAQLRERANQKREMELLATVKTRASGDHENLLRDYSELEKLAPGNPAYGLEAERQRAALSAELNEIEARNLRNAKEIERAERLKRGVRVGMTKEEVLMSSWGQPNSVNRTISKRGLREQWVYGSGSYLYFEDDALVTIQN